MNITKLSSTIVLITSFVIPCKAKQPSLSPQTLLQQQFSQQRPMSVLTTAENNTIKNIENKYKISNLTENLSQEYIKNIAERYQKDIKNQEFIENLSKKSSVNSLKNYVRWHAIAAAKMKGPGCSIVIQGGDIFIQHGILKNPDPVYITGEPYNVKDLENLESEIYFNVLTDDDRKKYQETFVKNNKIHLIPEIINNKDRKDYVNKLVQTYKIHLMPKENLFDTEKIFIKLLNSVKQNPQLQTYIGSIKIKFVDPLPQGVPRIVIYVYGIMNAQKALTILYNTFKNDAGSNLPPAYNETVTDLIFFAQGDRQYKDNKDFAKYFQDNKIYYKSDLTGESINYHLTKPEKPPVDIKESQEPFDERKLPSYMQTQKPPSQRRQTLPPSPQPTQEQEPFDERKLPSYMQTQKPPAQRRQPLPPSQISPQPTQEQEPFDERKLPSYMQEIRKPISRTPVPTYQQ